MLVNTFGTQTICILFSDLIADIVFLTKNLNNVQTALPLALTIFFNSYLARVFSGAPNENIVQNQLNIALLNVF